MDVFTLATWIGLLIPAVALFFLSRLSPRRYFFGLTVASGFRESPDGRSIENQYRVFVAAAFLVGAVVTAAIPYAVLEAILFVTVAGIVAFFYARHRVAFFAVTSQPPQPSQPAAAPLPRWTLLGLPPFAILLAIAIYLQAHWSEIPDRFPVHWGLDGRPNRWVERTPHGVYGPLIFGALLLIFMGIMGIATWYGARSPNLRVGILKILLVAMYLLGAIFGMVGLLPLHIFPTWAILLPCLVFVPAVIIYATQLTSDPSIESEPTPDSCWKLSAIYYNPADPALFVSKRIGIGYTFNFANPFSWVILGCMLALILSAFVIMK